MKLVELPILANQRTEKDGKQVETQLLADVWVDPAAVSVMFKHSDKPDHCILYAGNAILIIRRTLEDTKKLLGVE